MEKKESGFLTFDWTQARNVAYQLLTSSISAYGDSGIRPHDCVYGGTERVLEALTKHAFTNDYLPQQEHMGYIYNEQGTKKARHTSSTWWSKA